MTGSKTGAFARSIAAIMRCRSVIAGTRSWMRNQESALWDRLILMARDSSTLLIAVFSFLFQKRRQFQRLHRPCRRRSLADGQVEAERGGLEDHRLNGRLFLIGLIELFGDVLSSQGLQILALEQDIITPAVHVGGQLFRTEVVGAHAESLVRWANLDVLGGDLEDSAFLLV